MIDLKIKLLSKTSEDLIEFEKINEEAIPENERVTLYSLMESERNGDPKITGIYVQDAPAGFYVIRKYKNILYLAFLAVKKDLRSKGIGSKILKDLQNRTKDMLLIVDFESCDDVTEKNDQKLRRKSFYLKNGFTETGLYTYYDKTEFEIVCSKKEFRSEDIQDFFIYLGNLINTRISKPYYK